VTPKVMPNQATCSSVMFIAGVPRHR
jgi:hypothetical protein